MEKKKNNKTAKQTHYTVTFNDANQLMNVFTGKQEKYLFNTRGNMNFSNYIVKFVEEEYNTIEYHIFPKAYWRFEPEPITTLHDFLMYFYGMLNRETMKHRYGDAVWHCPDSNETYSLSDIELAQLEESEAFYNEIKHIKNQNGKEK